MANYVSDTFTDADATDIESHTPDSGGSWDAHSGELHIDGNRLVTSAIGLQVATNDAATASDDYQVSAVITFDGDTSDINCGLVIRYTGQFDNYQAHYNSFDDEWQLTKNVFSLLDSVSDVTFVEGQSRLIVLRAEADSITLSVDGVPTLSATDSGNTTGVGGVAVGGNGGVGWSVDNFSVDDIGADPDPGSHVVDGRGSVSIDTATEWLSTVIVGRPTVLSNGAAEPPNYYHVGMLSWGTEAHGAMVAYPVTRDLDLVRIPLGMDTLWFEFASGVTATITELPTP